MSAADVASLAATAVEGAADGAPALAGGTDAGATLAGAELEPELLHAPTSTVIAANAANPRNPILRTFDPPT